MIKLIDDESIDKAREYCEGDPFGCRILCAMKAYGIHSQFALFWAQYDECGGITAVVSLLDTGMTICARGEYDAEEMDCFAFAQIGFNDLLRPVREGEAADGLVMRLGERKSSDFTGNVTINPEISDLYAVIEECGGKGFETPPFESFYSDMMCRRKAKVTDSAVLFEDGMPVSCGAMHISDKTAVIIMCASVPDYRGKGHSSCVINALLDRANGRDVYLMCLPTLHDFYEKQGFVTVGGFSCGSR